MNIFPDDVSGRPDGLSALNSLSDDSSSMPPPIVTRDDIVGFWTIFDDQATEDSMNEMAKGGATKTSLFSAPLVLRADGQTSRGSDFPGGEWSMNEELGADGRTRKRLSIVLRSKLLKQEWRYEGLLFSLQLDSEVPESPSQAAAEAEVLRRMTSSADAPREPLPVPIPQSSTPPSPKSEIRVVGKANRWDVSDPSAAKPLGKETGFSMIKKEVDRRKLTPTIKPFTRPIDPEDVKIQSQLNRLREREEEDELRRAIDDVRRAKEEHGDNWREVDQLKEGQDYWRLGEDPKERRTTDDKDDLQP